jgi:predicted outer membrane lipoprotein
MTRRRLRAAVAGSAGALTACALLPDVAAAHGLVGRADLPIPTWLFGWAAAIVLAASFAALGALWREPRLEQPRERRVVRVPRVVDALCGALGMAFFGVVVYAGFAGSDVPTANIAPTSIYVIFWVGVVVLSVLFGDVFRAFSPWRSLAVAVAWVSRGRRLWSVRPYPERLGRWPAAVGILAFAWLELAYPPTDRTDPSHLAVVAVAYAVVQLAGMAVYGIEQWTKRGDAFGVYFNMFAQLSPWERRDGVLYLRPPLSGAPRWGGHVAGSVALLCVAIGSTSFDGFSNGPAWADLSPDIQSLFHDIGAGQKLALELASTVGLLFFVGLVALVYRLGIAGMRTVGRGHDVRELVGRFAHSLIPIAFAYAIAHYFSLLVYQSQAMGYLISDPLGDGSNIFGTAGKGIDYNVISGSAIWYVQVGALVCGHVAGLVLAHDRALSTYSEPREATRSQYWMLVVMVGFTSLGLWLLSAVSR